MNVDIQVLKHEIADLERKRVWVRADVVANKLAPKFMGSYQFIHASSKVVEMWIHRELLWRYPASVSWRNPPR
jgi:hypothetical protein